MLAQDQQCKTARHCVWMEVTGRFLTTRALRPRSGLSIETAGQEDGSTSEVSLDQLTGKPRDTL